MINPATVAAQVTLSLFNSKMRSKSVGWSANKMHVQVQVRYEVSPTLEATTPYK
jgi:hypothetical protein